MIRARPNTILLAAFIGLLWFILCRHLSNEWSVNEQYNYGWFVPFFAAYLFWLRWEDRPEVGSRESEVAKSVFLISTFAFLLFLLLPIRLFEIGNPDWRPLGWLHSASVIGLTLILIWRYGGAAWLRHFAFPVLFFFVAVPWISPIEGPIVQNLMRLVAAVATEAINLFGIPAQLEGSVIRVSSGLVGVNEACSGVRSLQTSLMIGMLFGELKRLSMARRFILVGAALLVALLANFARAFFLVWIAATRGTSAVDRWHDLAGYSIVIIVFAVCLAFTALLSRGKKSARPVPLGTSSATPRAAFRTPHFAAVLCWLFLVEAGVEFWYRSHEQNLQPRERWSVHWPEDARGFRELRIDENVRSTLRFDEGREATWLTKFDAGTTDLADNSAPGLTSCSLFFFRWNPGTATILRARAHRPDICLPNVGWRQAADDGVRNYPVAQNFSLPFRHFSFVRDRVPNQRPVFADAFFCLREDFVRASETGIAQFDPNSKTPTDWQGWDRIKVVREGLRNPGQQVMEFVAMNPAAVAGNSAEKSFAELVPTLIRLIPASR